MDDPVLRSSRREALVALLFFAAAFLVTLLACDRLGYVRDAPPAAPSFILGFPAWVFWGILVPWAASLAFGAWFAYGFMRDADLGREVDEEDGRDG